MASASTMRVIRARAVRSTRLSRRMIYIFIILVALLFVGVAAKAWPVVNVVIRPSLQSAEVELGINVQVNLAEPSPATLTLPARFMLPGEDRQLLMSKGLTVRSIDNDTIIFSQSDWLALIEQALNRQIPEGAVLLLPTLNITERKWEKQSSGSLFRSEISASVSYHLGLPLDTWPNEIKGLPKEVAKETLAAKPGIEDVDIQFFPNFLANLSQKIPDDPAAIRFTLDTE